MTTRYYACWRILYTIYWKIDASSWTYVEPFPRLENWLHDCMDSIGIRLGFLIAERMKDEHNGH